MSAAELAKITASLPNPDNVPPFVRSSVDTHAKNVRPQMPMSGYATVQPDQGEVAARPRSESIQLGDLVRLKSGGPCMVVVRATRADVTTQWFTEGELLHGTFLPIALVPADGPDD